MAGKKEVGAKGETVVSYKGLNNDLTCRDFQYAIGKSYKHDGEVAACESGFHACQYPLDVFRYYPPAGSRFCIVEQSGSLARHDSDSKVASQKIKIKAEINLAGLIKAAIEYTFSRSKPEDGASATGDQGAASATGDQGAASATGYQGAASATGYQGAASATGDQGAASATGDQGAAMACGYEGRASGKDGCALFLVERDNDYNIISAWAGIVGRDGIKAGTWYVLRGGKPEVVS
jgi:hypothetical protein